MSMPGMTFETSTPISPLLTTIVPYANSLDPYGTPSDPSCYALRLHLLSPTLNGIEALLKLKQRRNLADDNFDDKLLSGLKAQLVFETAPTADGPITAQLLVPGCEDGHAHHCSRLSHTVLHTDRQSYLSLYVHPGDKDIWLILVGWLLGFVALLLLLFWIFRIWVRRRETTEQTSGSKHPQGRQSLNFQNSRSSEEVSKARVDELPNGWQEHHDNDEDEDIEDKQMKKLKHKNCLDPDRTCDLDEHDHEESQIKMAKTFPCGMCSKTYTKNGRLREHIKTVHGTGVKKIFRCEFCDKTMASAYSRRRHIQAVHQAMKRHNCKQCDKVFTYKWRLDQHVRGDHQGMQYTCNTCKKVFKRKDSADRHSKATCGGGERKTCTVCRKNFKSANSLRQHKAYMHSKKPEKNCELCGEAFCRAYSLKRHIERKHTQ